MKKNFRKLEKYRVTNHPIYGTKKRDTHGLFVVPFEGEHLQCLSSGVPDSGMTAEVQRWEHVSVSVHGVDRCPTWGEMCHVKALFWDANEVVVQYHPAEKDYVNNHNFVLHLWKHTDKPFITPPSIAAGFKELNQ